MQGPLSKPALQILAQRHLKASLSHLSTGSAGLQGPPFKPALRILAERHLKRVIQQGEHDSVIDARAAMDLVQRKLAKGPAFGSFNSEEHGDKLMDVLHAHQRRCCLVDRHDMLNRHVTGESLEHLMRRLCPSM